MSHFEKFNEELPNKEKFYKFLTKRNISEKEHEHITKVWKQI